MSRLALLSTPAAGALALALVMSACKGGKDDDSPDDDGTTGTTGTTEPVEFTLSGVEEVLGVANLDDDNENGELDWDDADSGDEEIVLIALDSVDLPDGVTVQATLSGDLGAVRVWADGSVVLEDGADTVVLDGGLDSLAVEFGAPRAVAELSLSALDADGAETSSLTVVLEAAPLILNHHMQPAEWVVAVDVGGGAWGNADFIDGFSDGLGSMFETVDGRDVQYDVWIQDEIELGTMTAPGGQRVDLMIDSIRSNDGRYLGKYPDTNLGPDMAVMTWGSGRPTSQDSFGNLEVSPPVTVDGVDYPFGRIYHGDSGGLDIADELVDMMEAQQVQDPFTLDIGWLCVGHVDEFITFLPAPDAPKGFYLYVADIDVGYDFLEGLDHSMELPYYASGHGVDSIGEMLEDSSLWAYNRDLMDEHIEPNIDVLKTELGLDDADIIRVPGVFERSSECGGTALALIPATVNMQVTTAADGVSADLYIPDPFLREDPTDLDSDPFVAEFESLLPSNLTPIWLDDWRAYHLAWGEVHCGSNTRRTPTADWWTDARHLLEVSR